CLQHSTYPRTF
nr:immunoglobulin light chain junction region [Macaca mulatta]